MSADLTPITIPTTELRERDVIVRMDGHPAGEFTVEAAPVIDDTTVSVGVLVHGGVLTLNAAGTVTVKRGPDA